MVAFAIVAPGEPMKNAQVAAINPNKCIPALDDDGYGLFERSQTTEVFLHHNYSSDNMIVVLFVPRRPREDYAKDPSRNLRVGVWGPDYNGTCSMTLRVYTFHSTAILRYLATKYSTSQHWYPPDSELKARAKVDEAMAWFPGNLRCGLFYLSVCCRCL